jgi:hypothetical protein
MFVRDFLKRLTMHFFQICILSFKNILNVYTNTQNFAIFWHMCIKNAEFYAAFKSVTKIRNKCSQRRLFAENFYLTDTEVDKIFIFHPILYLTFCQQFFASFSAISDSAYSNLIRIYF